MFRPFFHSSEHKHSLLLLTSMILISSSLLGCGPLAEDLASVNYTPIQRDDWEISTPEEKGPDPKLVL
jgi:hypothetical protein